MRNSSEAVQGSPGGALRRQHGLDFARNRQMSLVSSGLQNKLKDSLFVMDTSSACGRQLFDWKITLVTPRIVFLFPADAAATVDDVAATVAASAERS